MAVNYTAYPAWNDPYNPWPTVSQVTVSAADVPLVTLSMISFIPTNINTPATYTVLYKYTNPETSAETELYYTYLSETSSIVWVLNYDGGTMVYDQDLANNTITLRAAPVKQVGSASGWKASEGGNVNSLYIQPVRTSYTPWEKRRKRLLGYK